MTAKAKNAAATTNQARRESTPGATDDIVGMYAIQDSSGRVHPSRDRIFLFASLRSAKRATQQLVASPTGSSP